MLIYIVKPNDTLRAIARRCGTDAEKLACLNQLSLPGRLTPGMSLIIPRERQSPRYEAEVNACVYPGVSSASLNYALPQLSSLSPFSYSFDSSGAIIPIDVSRLVAAARAAGAAPLMVVANTEEGRFSAALAHSVLAQGASREALIRGIGETLKSGGFAGVSIDFEHLYPFDRDVYSRFIELLSSELHALGYYVYVALAPAAGSDEQGHLCDAHDYAQIGRAADRVILMACEWGHAYSEPQAVSPVYRIRTALDCAVTAISPGKILLGLSCCAYSRTLPWRQGVPGAVLSSATAVSLAVATGSEIHFDTRAKAPYFNYTDVSGVRHSVWFEDARSTDERLRLVREYGLGGISVRTADSLYIPLWELICADFVSEKLI